MPGQTGQGFRLSPLQRRLWALAADGDDSPYRCRCAVLVEGDLDEDAWHAAVGKLKERHEILRTTFQTLPAVKFPVQVIHPATHARPAPLPDVRVGAAAHVEASPAPESLIEEFFQTEIEEFFHADASRDSRPDDGSCLRLSLCPLGGGRSLLLLSLPSLCADAPSLRLLLSDLAAAYEDCLSGAGTDDEPTQYADAAEWLNQLLEDEAAAAGVAYWKRQQPLAVPASPLHFESAAPALEGFRPASLRRRLDEPLRELIAAGARRLGVSRATWFLGCWQVLLWRLAGEEACTVGWACPGRAYEDLAATVGLLTRYLPLDCDLQSSQPLAEVLKRIEQACQEATLWAEYFSADALDAAGPGATTPFFRFCFDYADVSAHVAAAGLKFSVLAQTACVDRFGVRLSCVETDAGTLLSFDYDAAGCDAEGVRRLADQFVSLLRRAAAHADVEVGRLDIVGPAEREQVLFGFNSRTLEVEPSLLLHNLFESQAGRTPRGVALVAERGEVSYGELDVRADALSRFLRSRGVGPESLVCLYFERGAEMVVAMLGTLKAGAAYVPLDPEYPAAHLEDVLGDSGAEVVLTTADLEAGLPGGESLRVVRLDADWDEIAAAPERTPTVPPHPDHPAYVLYTSGSTGRPKGVVVSHRAVVNHMLWMQHEYPLTAGDAVLQRTPYGFDASVWEFYAPLAVGARLVLTRAHNHLNVDQLASSLTLHGITVLQVVPSLLKVLLEAPAFVENRTLRRVFCGGEELTRELAERFFSLSESELINLYGPTETTIQVVTWRCVRDETAAAQVPIGRPITNVRAYVLDGQMQPRPVGLRGELYVGGAALARGYRNRPGLTAESFIPDPFSDEPGARLYRTGDQAAWRADGTLDFFGRAGHQIKVRGFRVDLRGVEVVVGEHPSVQHAAAVVTSDSGDFEQLVCYYTARPAAELHETELRNFLARRLPHYMIPSSFRRLGAMPLTPNGKIDRLSLRARAARVTERKGGVPPRDLIEFRLVRIWERVLCVEPVGVTDSFFEIGGHSLLAVNLMAEVEREFGHNFPLAVLFQAPTVEALAVILRREISQLTYSPLVQIQKGDDLRPLFFVHPTGGNVLCYVELARHLGAKQPFYALQDPGLYQEQAPYHSLEEMAALYVRAVREAQPQGPYLLGGWSSGGVVAYEMAQQLQRGGEEVGMLAMLDSQAPFEAGEPPDEARLIRSVTALLAYMARLSAPSDPHAAPAQPAALDPLDNLLGLARAVKFLPPQAERAQVERLLEVFRRNVGVINGYNPRPYSRRITLFRASDAMPETISGAAVRVASSDPALGWGQLGTVKVYGVPGNHLTMTSSPFVQTLARVLSEKIDETNRIYDIGNRVMFWMLGH
jgi:amino acid adenylation domain-containing protein